MKLFAAFLIVLAVFVGWLMVTGGGTHSVSFPQECKNAGGTWLSRDHVCLRPGTVIQPPAQGKKHGPT